MKEYVADGFAIKIIARFVERGWIKGPDISTGNSVQEIGDFISNLLQSRKEVEGESVIKSRRIDLFGEEVVIKAKYADLFAEEIVDQLIAHNWIEKGVRVDKKTRAKFETLISDTLQLKAETDKSFRKWKRERGYRYFQDRGGADDV